MKIVLMLALHISTLANAQIASKQILSEAERDYVQLTQDFIQTSQDSSIEMRSWRQIYLKERFESRLAQIEKTLIESNKQIIGEINRVINEGGVESLDDVLLMRMAQLQMEKEQLNLSVKMKEYESQLKSFLDGRTKQAPQLPTSDYKEPIRYAQELLTRYPRSPLSDKAHYIMAYGLEEMGRFNEAAEIYKRLLRRHPYSLLSDEVNWRLGDFYFDSQDYKQAGFHYSQLTNKIDSVFYFKSIYKLGATYFAAGGYAKAGEFFTRLLNEIRSDQLADSENTTFEEEALDYLGVLLSKGITLEIDNKTRAEATQRLAKTYQRLPNEIKARETYMKFMSQDPYSPFVPNFAEQTVMSFLGESKDADAASVRDRLVRHLTKDNRWWKSNLSEYTRYFEGEDILESFLIDSAQDFAARGYAEKNYNLLRTSRDQYMKFLSEYFFSPFALQAKFELAQLEYFLGLYPASANTFKDVAQEAQDSSMREEASYGYLLSESRRVGFAFDKEYDLIPRRNANGDLLEKQKPSNSELGFISASSFYLENSDIKPKINKVRYKRAELYFMLNDFDASESELQSIIDDKENVNQTTAKALRLSAEIADIKGDWKTVSKRNSELLNLTFNSSNMSSDEMDKLKPANSALDIAGKLEKSGRKSEAILEYQKIANAFPRSSFTPYVHWKVASLSAEEGKNKDALQELPKLKGTDYQAESEFLEAKVNYSLLRFQKSAELFESFVKKYPRNSLAPEALLNASALRRDLKFYKESVALLLQNYQYTQMESVLFDAVDIAMKAKLWNEAIGILARVSKKNPQNVLKTKVLSMELAWQQKKYPLIPNLCRDFINGVKNNSKSALAQRGISQCRFYDASLKMLNNDPNAAARSSEVEKLLRESGQDELLALLKLEQYRYYTKNSQSNEAFNSLVSGFATLKLSPYGDVGELFYQEFKNLKKFPAHVGLLAPWKVADGLISDWPLTIEQSLAVGQARSLCEREEYESCLEEFRVLSVQTPNEDILQAKFLAELKAGNDSYAINSLKALANRTGWFGLAGYFSRLISKSDLLPDPNLAIEIPPQGGRVQALTAQAMRLLDEKKYRSALDTAHTALEEDSFYLPAYVVAAQIFHETGHYGLMKESLREGVRITKNRGALLGLYDFWSQVLGGSSVVSESELTDQLNHPALLGVGLGAVVSGNIKKYEAVQSLLSKKSAWTYMLLNSAKIMGVSGLTYDFGGYENKSAHVTWLKYLSNTSDVTLKESSLQLGLRRTKFFYEFEGSAR